MRWKLDFTDSSLRFIEKNGVEVGVQGSWFNYTAEFERESSI